MPNPVTLYDSIKEAYFHNENNVATPGAERSQTRG